MRAGAEPPGDTSERGCSSSLKMGLLGRCLGLAFSSPILTHTSLSPQNPPPPPPRHLGGASKTPREFLAELPPGPYTCLRGRGLALLGFDFHYQRFQEGLRYAEALFWAAFFFGFNSTCQQNGLICERPRLVGKGSREVRGGL